MQASSKTTLALATVGALGLTISLPQGAAAQTVNAIPITNANFTQPATLPSQGFTDSLAPGFLGDNSTVNAYGVQGISGTGLPVGTARQGYINQGDIYQNVAATITAGATYTFTGYVGNNVNGSGTGNIFLYTACSGGYANPDSTGNTNGTSGTPVTFGTRLAAGVGVLVNGMNEPFTATYTALPGDPNIGKQLSIVLSKTGGDQADFANLSLTAATPAPEPSQTAALGVGLLGLAGLVLKARKRQVVGR